MKEIWKEILGSNNRYFVSNMGGFKKNDTILNQYNDSDGYLLVSLFLNNKWNTHRSHRIILETFVGPCPKGMICRHLDGNPKNNRLDNLEWNTNSINMKDRTRHGTQPKGEKASQSKFSNIDILNMRHLYKNGWTTGEIGRKYNTNHKVIWKIITYKTWTHLK